MEEVKEFSNLEDFVSAFSEAGKALSEVKVFGVGGTDTDKEPIKVIDGTKVIKEFFETFLDDDTKNLVNKFSGTTATEKIDMFREYHNKLKSKEEKAREQKAREERVRQEKGKEEVGKGNKEKEEVEKEEGEKRTEIKIERRSNVNDLVQKERELNSRIKALSAAEQKEYYAKLYQIPTEKDLHAKLDAVLERLEDLSSEVAIIRRHLYSK